MDRLIQMLIPLIVKNVIPNISMQLVDIIADFAIDFEERAKETDNAWDDIAAAFLITVIENLTLEMKRKYSVKRPSKGVE
jgi:hypothetical protein